MKTLRSLILRFGIACMLAMSVSSIVALPAWSVVYQQAPSTQSDPAESELPDMPSPDEEERSGFEELTPEAPDAYRGNAIPKERLRKAPSKPDPKGIVPPSLHVPPESVSR